jgi:hypothetical protein
MAVAEPYSFAAAYFSVCNPDDSYAALQLQVYNCKI